GWLYPWSIRFRGCQARRCYCLSRSVATRAPQSLTSFQGTWVHTKEPQPEVTTETQCDRATHGRCKAQFDQAAERIGLEESALAAEPVVVQRAKPTALEVAVRQLAEIHDLRPTVAPRRPLPAQLIEDRRVQRLGRSGLGSLQVPGVQVRRETSPDRGFGGERRQSREQLRPIPS